MYIIWERFTSSTIRPHREVLKVMSGHVSEAQVRCYCAGWLRPCAALQAKQCPRLASKLLCASCSCFRPSGFQAPKYRVCGPATLGIVSMIWGRHLMFGYLDPSGSNQPHCCCKWRSMPSAQSKLRLCVEAGGPMGFRPSAAPPSPNPQESPKSRTPNSGS